MFPKDPQRMYVEDINLAKEALDNASKLIESRLSMIEKIDAHPLSWSVSTQFQKMKRAKTDDEDDKLFAAAEKKVKEDKKAKEDEARLRKISSGKQKLNFVSKAPFGKFGNAVDFLLVEQGFRFCFVDQGRRCSLLHCVMIENFGNYGFLG